MIFSLSRWSWLSSVEWDILGTGVRLLIGSGGGWPPPGRQGGQNCDGALFQQGPYRDTPHRSGGCLSAAADGRQIGAKASTEPVALRVRPRPRKSGSTMSEPHTKTHSCVTDWADALRCLPAAVRWLGQAR